MRKLALSLAFLGLTGAAVAQDTKPSFEEKIMHNGWFNHIDLAVTAGTTGFGFDFAAPLQDWGRVRAGAVFRPIRHYTATFGMKVAEGLSKDIDSTRFESLASDMEAVMGYRPKKSVTLQGDMGFNNAKLLIDFFPFKKHREWHFTVGFYYGNSDLVDIKNTPESMNTLMAIGTYNKMYKKALAKENPIDVDKLAKMLGYSTDVGQKIKDLNLEPLINKIRQRGLLNDDQEAVTTETDYYYYDEYAGQIKGTATTQSLQYAENGISVKLGSYARDIIAQEDIYYDYTEKLYQESTDCDDNTVTFTDANGNVLDNDQFHYQKDANGRYIKARIVDEDGNVTQEGTIRYHKGEVIHKAGDVMTIVPDENNILEVKGTAEYKFKPYIGIGYERSFFRDKRLTIGIDAGIMIWGGHPSVTTTQSLGLNAAGQTVYTTYDISRDVTDYSSAVKSYMKSVMRYPVVPEISLRIAHRLW